MREETRCHHMGYSFWLAARVLLYAPYHRQDSTYHGLCYTSYGALAGTKNSSMGPPHEGSIRRPIAPWSYISLLFSHVLTLSCVRLFGLCTVDHQNNPTCWTQWLTSQSTQCSTSKTHIQDCGVCYPVRGMVHIKEPLLLPFKYLIMHSTHFN